MCEKVVFKSGKRSCNFVKILLVILETNQPDLLVVLKLFCASWQSQTSYLRRYVKNIQ